MGHDVFISYSSRDKKVADAACALIERRGYRCWIAPRDILSGMEWGKAIVDGIRGARVFVLIFSANANRSPQVNREVERAVGNGLPIVPFRIEDVAPSDSLEYFISNQHWLDALTPPLARHLNQLGDVVGRLLGAESPVRQAVPAASGRHKWTGWRAGGVAAAIVLAAVGGWLLFPEDRTADRAPAPVSQDEELLDFASIRTAPGEPGTTPGVGGATAEDHLRNARVPVRIVELSPGFASLFFVNSNSPAFAGFGLSGPGRNLLVYAAGYAELPGPVTYAVVLEFAEPVAEVSFDMPSFRHFAGVRIRAYSTSGEEIASVTREPNSGAPQRRTTLTARGGHGIRRIRFEPFMLLERPYPPVFSILIERIGIRRMARFGE